MILDLKTHPSEEASFIDKASVELSLEPNALRLGYKFLGDMKLLEVEPAKEGQKAQRKDNLWMKTCCELFISQASHSSYLEFNFAPNGNWSVYSFTSYRKDRCDPTIEASPLIESHYSKHEFNLDVSIDKTELVSLLNSSSEENDSSFIQMGICAITHTHSGHKIHWALHHPLSSPDFHDINSLAVAFNLNPNDKDH